MRKLPPLASVRVFEAAARLCNFTKAADELGMTQAAVSYQIKLLEERVGTPLFLRGPRNVELTEAGARLAPAVTQALDVLSAAFAAVHDDSRNVLRITSLHTFASNWLAPRLGTFQLSHPGIAVQLDASSHLVDFAREEVDVGIRGGGGSWPGLIEHRLMDWACTPMCSPEFLERVGGLSSPLDLQRVPLISPDDPWWSLWFAAVGIEAPRLDGRPSLRVGMQQIEGAAAIAGQGVALLTPGLWTDDLAAGRLVQPFEIVAQTDGALWLVYPEAKRHALKVHAFRDWLLGELAAAAPASRAA